MQPNSFNKAVSYAVDRVGKSRMALKDAIVYFTKYFSVLLSASSGYVS